MDNTPRMIKKVVCITTNKTQASEYSYWIDRPAAERLEALELLRQSYMSFLNVPPRLQRVYRVINTTSG